MTSIEKTNMNERKSARRWRLRQIAAIYVIHVLLILPLGKEAKNNLLSFLARILPGGYDLRPYLQRLRGVKIGDGVWIAEDVCIDERFPETIEIQDQATIAPRCTLIGYTKGPGRIVIGKRAAIGAGCVITCRSGQTLTIGEGALVSAGSIVANDIPAFTLCGPPRIKTYATIRVPFREAGSFEEFWGSVQPIRAKQ
jgi:acetyltransferase-like isoleucine patch superfamily enzyme